MKQYIRIIILIAFALVYSHQSEAQANEGVPGQFRIESVARAYGDSIVLRWAPNQPAVWLMANDYGYLITRSFVNSEGQYITEQLTSEPLMPWPLERMMEAFGPSDTIAAIVAEVLYGEGFIEMEIDDGGTNFVHSLVKQQRNQEMRYSVALQAADFRARIADALALRYVDTDVREGVLYTYLIESAIPPDAAEVLNSTEIVMCEPFIPVQDTLWLEAMQNDSRTILISWRRNHCSAFYIERSEDNGRSWKRLNSQPYYSSLPDGTPPADMAVWYDHLRYHHVFSDSIEGGRQYLYRVQGIDAFADLTPYSEVLEVELADIIPPAAPQMLQPEVFNNEQVQLAWIKETIEPDLAGYYIQFSHSGSGPFTEVHDGLIPASESMFTDEMAGERGAGYYRVIAIDHSGNQSMSFPVRSAIEDLEPPSKPTGLNGIIYSDAVAEIYWNPNPEPDVKGYRVFYANQADHAFVALTPSPVEQAWYRDTVSIKTLTRHIYYQVLAEDFSGNMSPVSDILELIRPDIVPPPVAVALDGRQDEENVYITWAASPANDVLVYRIFRKAADDDEWQLVKMLQRDEVDGQIDFTDSPPASQKRWQYVVEVLDESGLSSGMSKVLSFRVRGKRELAIPIELAAAYDKESQLVKANWRYSCSEPHYVVLYRGFNGAEPMAVRSLEPSVTSYADQLDAGSTSVQYYVQICLQDGRRSLPSNAVTLKTD